METKSCEECSLLESILYCDECDQLFCDSCNEKIHRNGKRKTHTRGPIPTARPTDNHPVSIPSAPQILLRAAIPDKTFASGNFLKPPVRSGFDINDISKPPSRRVHGKQSSAETEVYQVSKRKAANSENFLDKGLIPHLKKWAYEGKIMHEFKELREKVAVHLCTSQDVASNLIEIGCRVGRLMQQTKRIGMFDFNIVSLKVENLSVKVLLWVLRSLKADEMISTEKAIQSRMKEAFDIKINPLMWAGFLENALKFKMNHKKSCSQTPGFSLFSHQEGRRTKNFCFQMKTIKDLGTGSENIVIYPVNEEWISYDQYIKSGDVFQIKQSQEWRSFLAFFENLYKYDCSEDKAISGGRYGCAQYLKKSSELLQHSSLGKLSYMIQLAIDEDLLRYHKTLLVYVPAFDKKCKEDKQALLSTKRLEVDILSTCSEGISLAQLPTLIKEKHPIDVDLSKLGFAKLKDLINEIPDIELSSKGKNHPFVRVVKVNQVSIEAVLALLKEKLEEFGKISIIDFEIEVGNSFGYSFRWNFFKQRTLEDFLKIYGDFVVIDRGFIDKRQKFYEKNHSYTSSTTSDAYSYYACPENCLDDTKYRMDDLEDQQKKFIDGLLEDEAESNRE